MKRLIIILVVSLIVCVPAIAKQPKATVDTTTAVTVVSVDTTNVDSNECADSSSVRSHKSYYSDDLYWKEIADHFTVSIIPLVAILCVFGLPAFLLFIIFYFRYKSRKARYRLVEKALESGQPLPTELMQAHKWEGNLRSRAISKVFTGFGLFIFLWAITDEFGIGAIGLLIMFMGIGQWIVSLKEEKEEQPRQQEPESQKKEEPILQQREVRRREPESPEVKEIRQEGPAEQEEPVEKDERNEGGVREENSERQ